MWRETSAIPCSSATFTTTLPSRAGFGSSCAATLGAFDIFSSSDQEAGVQAGDDWLAWIADKLRNCSVLITICTPISVNKPWINFEVGAAWTLAKRIIPACHAGLEPDDLRIPFATRQGLKLAEPDGLERLFRAIADQFGLYAPDDGYDQRAARVPAPADSGMPTAQESIERQLLDAHRGARRRLREALEAKDPWRTIRRLSVEAGVPEGEVLEILRNDEDVQLGENSKGERLAGLKRRLNK